MVTLFGEDDEIAVINIPDPDPIAMVRLYYAGKFMLVKETGYWYNVAPRLGHLTRIKYKGQVTRLNQILKDVKNGTYGN